MCLLEEFANDKYKLLSFLYDNQIQVKEDTYIPLSQQEISVMINFSKFKVNKLINELKENGCVVPYKNIKGKYAITDKGYEVISVMKGEIK